MPRPTAVKAPQVRANEAHVVVLRQPRHFPGGRLPTDGGADHAEVVRQCAVLQHNALRG